MSDDWDEDDWDEELEEELEEQVSEHDPFSLLGLAAGSLSLVPLLALYELALPGRAGERSTAELAFLISFERLGVPAEPVRWTVILLLALFGVVTLARAGRGVVPATLGIVLEGAVASLVLGPVLVGLLHLFEGVVPLPDIAPPQGSPGAGLSAFVVGASAWEELLLRVVIFSGIFLLGRRVVGFFGAGDRSRVWIGEALALLGSAAAYAALHLESFTGWLAPGGEAFEPSAFTWRLTAGILLGLLFRWRGVGVSAWAHGLFNLALLLGAGPDVFV